MEDTQGDVLRLSIDLTLSNFITYYDQEGRNNTISRHGEDISIFKEGKINPWQIATTNVKLQMGSWKLSHLDYENWVMVIPTRQYKVEIPIHVGPDEEKLIIPPRCGILWRVEKLKEDTVILNQKIALWVFITRAIISSTASSVRILNTNCQNSTLKPRYSQLL